MGRRAVAWAYSLRKVVSIQDEFDSIAKGLGGEKAPGTGQEITRRAFASSPGGIAHWARSRPPLCILPSPGDP